jgi:transposase-like protein
MATDWTKLQSEFVHGHMTMRELAERHGIKASGVMRRAAIEKWDEKRKQESANVSKAVTERARESRIDELAHFNAEDLAIAKQIRKQVEQHMASAPDVNPNELRALAASAEAAQRIGRLALGVPTDNKSISGPGGGPLTVAAVDLSTATVEQLRALAMLRVSDAVD